MEVKQAGDLVLVWAAMTKYHTLHSLKQQKVFSHSSENCQSEIRVPAQLGSVRALFWVAD